MLSATQAYAGELLLKDIRIGEFEGKTRFVMDVSSEIEYRLFHLDNPRRVVIDLPTAKWRVDDNVADPSGVIGRYRHGQFNKQTSRVVLDLKRPAVIDNAFLLAPDYDRPYRLVIDLKAASYPTYKKNLETVFGVNRTPRMTNKQLTQAPTPPTQESDEVIVYEQKPETSRSVLKPLIVIDPGHGGPDPGAIAKNGMYEKNITLAAAKELKRQLTATGRYRVLLTRETDVYLKLRQRSAIARRHKADLFISLHADSLNRSNVRGASIYTLSNTASDKEAAKLAARENKADTIIDYDLSSEQDDVASILLDLRIRDTLNHSKVFADILVEAFQDNRITLLDNSHRFAGFAVLKAPDIPAVLVEMGFLSNSFEANRLSTASYRRKVMTGIADGIDRYFEEGKKQAVF